MDRVEVEIEKAKSKVGVEEENMVRVEVEIEKDKSKVGVEEEEVEKKKKADEVGPRIEKEEIEELEVNMDDWEEDERKDIFLETCPLISSQEPKVEPL